MAVCKLQVTTGATNNNRDILKTTIMEVGLGLTGRCLINDLSDGVNRSLNVPKNGPWHVILCSTALQVGLCHSFMHHCTSDVDVSGDHRPGLHAVVVYGIYEPEIWP
jgi:hypothetical protein